jgi:uncharacterized membrane protein HdeD (DUF308 family)
MKLIDDWQWVKNHAWSARLIALAAVLSGLEVLLSVMASYAVATPLPPGVFALLSGLVTVAAFAARFIAQKHDGVE